jgi:AraC-like DNA-binding protein
VASGSVCATEDENLYKMHQGDMIIHAPMEFHTIMSADGTHPNVYIITFMADGMLPENLTKGVLGLTVEEQDEFSRLFNKIFTFYNKDVRDDLECQECMDSFTSFLIRTNFNHTIVNDSVLSQSESEYENIVKTMTNHVCDNCSLEEIAKLCNMSVSNVKVLFRKFCGISPKLYYSRLRTTEAIKLMSSGMSASETANKLSFSSSNYFNTFFKRMTGKPPAAFNRHSG